MTIQSTGMGGPSAAIVFTELIGLGARRAIRVGTCGALSPELGLGDLVVALDAIGADGTSRALGAAERVPADPDLSAESHAGRRARTPGPSSASTCSTRTARAAGGRRASQSRWRPPRCSRLGAGAGVPVACVLAVTDVFAPDDSHTRIPEAALLEAAERMGRAALAAMPA